MCDCFGARLSWTIRACICVFFIGAVTVAVDVGERVFGARVRQQHTIFPCECSTRYFLLRWLCYRLTVRKFCCVMIQESRHGNVCALILYNHNCLCVCMHDLISSKFTHIHNKHTPCNLNQFYQSNKFRFASVYLFYIQRMNFY